MRNAGCVRDDGMCHAMLDAIAFMSGKVSFCFVHWRCVGEVSDYVRILSELILDAR